MVIIVLLLQSFFSELVQGLVCSTGVPKTQHHLPGQTKVPAF